MEANKWDLPVSGLYFDQIFLLNSPSALKRRTQTLSVDPFWATAFRMEPPMPGISRAGWWIFSPFFLFLSSPLPYDLCPNISLHQIPSFFFQSLHIQGISLLVFHEFVVFGRNVSQNACLNPRLTHCLNVGLSPDFDLFQLNLCFILVINPLMNMFWLLHCWLFMSGVVLLVHWHISHP